MRSAVSPGRLESMGEAAIGQSLEPTQSQRRAGDITAEAFEPLSVSCRDGYIGMQAQAALANAARRHDGPKFDPGLVLLDRLHPIAEPSPRLARLGARRDPRADRRRAEHRHQGPVATRERIVLLIAPESFEPP